ncbi:MAG TPA: glycosyltransferase [Anaerohalosphaeraceae bacterium]|nr:glycosyltransferase [Anaerohalosphaeraceae bacterium]HOL89093.1 glycosyltransferase [Anaerohalosphaeraceae bacterium]HPP56633.1 glycosyltransferase [Anaerohalosphaeraceae bacterium]
MAWARRILIIGDFKLHSPESLRIERRHWIKGFVRNGCDVQTFSYRNILHHFTPFHKRRYAFLFGRRKTEKSLIQIAESYRPDIVLISNMRDVSLDCLGFLRDVLKHTIFLGRDNDWKPAQNKERMQIARKMDIVLATNAGSWLQDYKKAGVPVCAFMPCPCDPDIQHPYESEPHLQADILFIGRSEHPMHATDPDRIAILKQLSRMPSARIYGSLGYRRIEGLDAFRAISNTKIALSINADNSQRLCHSDRFINCLACGAFTLAKWVPDSNLLFEDRREVKYFRSVNEFFDLADWYLQHEEERRSIAQAGMEKAHSQMNCTLMAQRVLDLVETGSYSAPWKYIL